MLASKSGCTRTSARAEDSQSSSRTQLSSVAPIPVRAPWPWRWVHQPPVGSFIAQPAVGPGQRAAWAADGVSAPEKPAPLCSLFGTIARVSTGSRGHFREGSGGLSLGSGLAHLWAPWREPGAFGGAAGKHPRSGCSSQEAPPWGPGPPESSPPHLPAQERSHHQPGLGILSQGDSGDVRGPSSPASCPWLGLQQARVEGGAGPPPGRIMGSRPPYLRLHKLADCNVAGEAPQAGGGSGRGGLSPGGLFCPVRGRHLRSSTWPGLLRVP